MSSAAMDPSSGLTAHLLGIPTELRLMIYSRFDSPEERQDFCMLQNYNLRQGRRNSSRELSNLAALNGTCKRIHLETIDLLERHMLRASITIAHPRLALGPGFFSSISLRQTRQIRHSMDLFLRLRSVKICIKLFFKSERDREAAVSLLCSMKSLIDTLRNLREFELEGLCSMPGYRRVRELCLAKLHAGIWTERDETVQRLNQAAEIVDEVGRSLDRWKRLVESDYWQKSSEDRRKSLMLSFLGSQVFRQ